jgi:hypothetical protein
MQGLHWQLLEHPGVVVITSDVVGLGVVVVVVVVVVGAGVGAGVGLHGGGQPHGEQGHHGMQGLHWQLLEHPGVVVISSDVVGLGVVVVVVVVVVVGGVVGWVVGLQLFWHWHGLHGAHGMQGLQLHWLHPGVVVISSDVVGLGVVVVVVVVVVVGVVVGWVVGLQLFWHWHGLHGAHGMQGLQLHWLHPGVVVISSDVVGLGVVVVVVVVVVGGWVVVIGTHWHGMHGHDIQGLHGWQLLVGWGINSAGDCCPRVSGHLTLGHVCAGPSHLR